MPKLNPEALYKLSKLKIIQLLDILEIDINRIKKKKPRVKINVTAPFAYTKPKKIISYNGLNNVKKGI